jgi:hypothetical protein
MAPHITACSFGREMATTTQIKQHSVAVMPTVIIVIRRQRQPLSDCVTANAVAIFNFEEAKSTLLFVASIVEVLALPPMFRCSVEKSCHQTLVPQQHY